jgi:hypothetical protein
MDKKQKYLLTYVCQVGSNQTFGHEVIDDPVKWMDDIQDLIKGSDSGETYYILNLMEIDSVATADRWDGSLYGM